MNAHHTARSPRRIMWAAIGASLGLLSVLLALGWHDRAWTIAAGALLLSCVAVCIWATVQGRNTDREIRLAIERLAATRRDDARRRSPRSRHQ